MRGGTEVETTFAAQGPVDVQMTHNKPSARYHSDVEAQDVPDLGLVSARCNAKLVQISADTNIFQRLYPPGGVGRLAQQKCLKRYHIYQSMPKKLALFCFVALCLTYS